MNKHAKTCETAVAPPDRPDLLVQRSCPPRNDMLFFLAFNPLDRELLDLISVGSVAFGLVWGWLLLFYNGRSPSQHPFWNTLVLLGVTAFVSYQIYTLTNGRSLILFLIAVGVAGYSHWLWLKQLRGKI